MIAYAHSKKDRPVAEWQTLDAHSKAVAALAKEFALHLRAGEWGWAVGLLHDVGKARLQFQQMLQALRARGNQTDHAKYGAKLAFDADSLPLAFAVAGHHAGLPDFGDLQNLARSTDALPLPEGYTFPAEASLPFSFTPEEDILPLEFFTRLLFSCLIDADRLDSAFWECMGDRTFELAMPKTPLSPSLLP